MDDVQETYGLYLNGYFCDMTEFVLIVPNGIPHVRKERQHLAWFLGKHHHIPWMFLSVFRRKHGLIKGQGIFATQDKGL
jgi:hypothetical protein